VRSSLLGAAAALVAVAVGQGTSILHRRTALAHVRSGTSRPHRRARAASDLAAALVPDPPQVVVRAAKRAGIRTTAIAPVWRSSVGAAAVVISAATIVGGVGVATLVVALGTFGVVLATIAVGDRASVLVDRELPAVLAAIASGVRSGASLTGAVREGSVRARGPAGEDLRVVVESLAAGRSLVDAIDAWVRARPTPGVRMAGAALILAAETGGAGARTIDGVAATLRDRLAVDRELAALSSQARASAVVIGVAPIGFVVLTAMSDPGVWDFFLRTPAGLGCLAAGCLLDAAGAAAMVLVARGPR
jgi:tight adherence protein B